MTSMVKKPTRKMTETDIKISVMIRRSFRLNSIFSCSSIRRLIYYIIGGIFQKRREISSCFSFPLNVIIKDKNYKSEV